MVVPAEPVVPVVSAVPAVSAVPVEALQAVQAFEDAGSGRVVLATSESSPHRRGSPSGDSPLQG